MLETIISPLLVCGYFYVQIFSDLFKMDFFWKGNLFMSYIA